MAIYHSFINDYPKDSQLGWSANLQGVTHDDLHWYITNQGSLWKFPVTYDLNNHIPWMLDWQSYVADRGILWKTIPQEFKDKGYDHFGDLDYFKGEGLDGYLFVPLQISDQSKTPPGIMVFDASNLEYIGYNELYGFKHKGGSWCAIESETGILYIPDGDILPDQPIKRYKIDLTKLRIGSFLQQIEPFQIFDASGLPMELTQQQGGTFSPPPENNLYINCGFWKDSDTKKHGIRVFDKTGMLIAASSNDDLPFLYEYHPGYLTADEPEGITYWDLNDGKAPHIRGHLHAFMINNDADNADDLYFKHYFISESPWVGIKDPMGNNYVHKASCPYVASEYPHGFEKIPYLNIKQAFKDGYRGCIHCSPYIANTHSSSKEVHIAGCEWINKIVPEHKFGYFKIEHALKDGFDGCFYCLSKYHHR